MIFVRQSHDGPAALHGEQIQHAIVIDVHDRNCIGENGTGYGSFSKLPLPLVIKNMELQWTIDDRGVGVTISVEIGPGKVSQSLNVWKWLNLSEAAVTVVP